MRSLTFVCAATALAVSAGCASKKDSDPPTIAFSVDFPSQQAAALTESVKLYVFQGALVCNDLVRLRQTQQALPPAVVETPSLPPCLLARREGSTVDLPLAASYTMLAVGQIGGRDVFVGCAVQHAYGTTQAAPIPLSFIDDRQRLPPTTCVKLSDKCNGACK